MAGSQDTHTPNYYGVKLFRSGYIATYSYQQYVRFSVTPYYFQHVILSEF